MKGIRAIVRRVMGMEEAGLGAPQGVSRAAAKRIAPERFARPGRVRELVAKGLTDAEIAAEIGCSRAAVKKQRQRLGLRSPRHGPGLRSLRRKAGETSQRTNGDGPRVLGQNQASKVGGNAQEVKRG